MATRTVTYKSLDDVTALDVLVAMYDEGDAPTENNPISTVSVALAVNLTDSDAFSLLGLIADNFKIIDGERGQWWFTNAYESSEEMAEAYSKLEALAVKGSKRAAAKAKPAGKPVKTAQSPVKAADGTTVTVPVSEGSEERRELDASKGERILAEDDMREIVKSLNTPAVAAFDVESSEHESDIVKHGLALDEPEFIPAMTPSAVAAGISENEWYMMYAALTQTARDWWTKRVSAKIEAHDTANKQEQPVYATTPATAAETGF